MAARRRPSRRLPPTTPARYKALLPERRRVVSRVAEAQRLLAEGGATSPTHAARLVHTTLATWRETSPDLVREGRHYRLKSPGQRRLYQGPVLLLTDAGPRYAEPRNDAQRAAAGRFWAWVRAVDRADEQGRRPPEPPADVRRLARTGVGGVRPTVDAGRVLDLLAEGALDDLPPISPRLGDDDEEGDL